MIYAVIFVGLIFIAIAFVVTVDNAKQILSGYNTMSKEEQKKFDIASFIPFFKKFHIALGLSFLVIGLLLTFFMSEKITAAFIGIFPIVAYIYFIQKSSTFYDGKNKPINKYVQFFLIAVLIFIIMMVWSKEMI